MKKMLFAMIAVLMVLPMTAMAAYIPVAESDWTGSRSSLTGDGLTITGTKWDGSGDNGFKISWNIAKNLNDATYAYIYNVTGAGTRSAQNVSSVLKMFGLEVGKPNNNSNFSNWSYSPGNLMTGPTDLGIGLYGYEFSKTHGNKDLGKKFQLSFTTKMAPVWGDFYASSVSGDIAKNAGFGSDPNPNGLFINYIATPVPIPAAVWLLGAGLIGLVTIRRRMTKN
jgi:hypothetical protein